MSPPKAAKGRTRTRSTARLRAEEQSHTSPGRYDLYERAAQSPHLQARFLRALHPAPEHSRLTLGEDFAGTGAVSRAFVSLFPGCRAVCADHDETPLARLRASATPAITIRHADVRAVRDRADIIAVLNFSICEWRSRADLLSYLAHARSRLKRRGLLVADLYGGRDAFITGRSDVELRESDIGPPVRYIWEQREADPVTGHVVNAMHFLLPGRRPLRDAFVYNWRLWSLAELRDAMLESGFRSVEVHDRLGDALDADGRLFTRPIPSGAELDDNYVAYVVARV